SDAEVEEWGPVLQRIRKEGRITVCGSFGVLSADQAQKLAKFGMQRYNHNLQTSRRFFPNIISTHSYDDRLATLRHVKNAGISVCCGALFGMGETWADRIDLAFELRELDVDVVPINFLIPIDGTPLAGSELLDPLECLKIIALYRFCLPQKEIKIAGGRETCLRDLQSWIFFAGASSFMIGNYLTTCGRPAADDRQMVRDGGLELAESVTSSQAISAGRRV
ncbi:MAG: biotin synthase BioB, partial [Phycisphaerae bacterium]|nr:biotin synthase BioB [Phycisphaerae bacterium]